MSRGRAALASATLLAVAACVPTNWDTAPLAGAHPALAGLEAHRLGDTTPYVIAARGELVLFLCRWSADRPVPVSLPADVTDEERDAVQSALRAWQQVLPLEFEPGELDGYGIEIRFVDFEEGGGPIGAGDTVADCDVSMAPGAALPAELVFASIHLRRAALDFRGNEIPHDEGELYGSALHELGHALGYQGHAHAGATVMVRSIDSVRRAGRRLARGESFGDETLRALYAVPSGTVVWRGAVPERRTADLDRIFDSAGHLGLAGPRARVGDVAARISWRSAGGAVVSFLVPDPEELLHDPETFGVLPSSATMRLLRGAPLEEPEPDESGPD